MALLVALSKKLVKPAVSLKKDFGELAASARTFDQLGAAGAPMESSLAEAFHRADLSLSERTDLAADYAAFLSGKHLTAVQKTLTAVATARAAAAVETKTKRRGALYVRADAALTAALGKADKFLLVDRGAEFRPPTRYRSGDFVGQAGGLVAIPRDAGTPLAGASILIPVQSLSSGATITLSEGTSFVAGRNVATGPALVVGPDGLAAVGAVLRIPYQLPPDTDPQGLALFAKGPPELTILPVTLDGDGTLTAEIQRLSTFQAGIAAPPPGQPGGTYHVLTWTSVTLVDAAGTGTTGVGAGVMDQSVNFRLNHTGSTTVPGFPGVTRVFTGSGPNHHTDDTPSFFTSQVDFTWTAHAAGRFSFDFPLSNGSTATAQGVASDDGRVVSWSGRGGNIEFFAVGVRADTGFETADLEGRWAAVELGMELRDSAAEPFTTRRHDAFRSFSVDAAGALTFEATGTRYEADVTYRTDQPIPTHFVTENVAADAGSETWAVSPLGRITNTAGLRAGWLSGDAGALVSTYYDTANARISLLVAVKQAATTDGTHIPGLYHVAQTEVGTIADSANGRSSRHEITPRAADLDVASVTSATLSEDATTRVLYTLDSEVGIVWTMVSTTTALPAVQTPLAFALDAAGNERQASDSRYFAFSSDGRYVLTLTRGDPTRLARGIGVGVR